MAAWGRDEGGDGRGELMRGREGENDAGRVKTSVRLNVMMVVMTRVMTRVMSKMRKDRTALTLSPALCPMTAIRSKFGKYLSSFNAASRVSNTVKLLMVTRWVPFTLWVAIGSAKGLESPPPCWSDKGNGGECVCVCVCGGVV